LPDFASSSICLSHRSAWNSANQRASLATSPGGEAGDVLFDLLEFRHAGGNSMGREKFPPGEGAGCLLPLLQREKKGPVAERNGEMRGG
jgi:hypothetical protein